MRKIQIFFTTTGLLLLAAAFALGGYNLWDSERAAASAEAVLEQLLPTLPDDAQKTILRMDGGDADVMQKPARVPDAADSAETVYPDYILNPEMDMPVQKIDGADYIGVLTIPALEMRLPILSEYSDALLKTAPCRYAGSAYLDDMVIAGHNYQRHFGMLNTLSIDDIVEFLDIDGNVFSYRVVDVEILDAGAVEAMTNSHWDMTLFTCTLSGSQRITIRCEREKQ